MCVSYCAKWRLSIRFSQVESSLRPTEEVLVASYTNIAITLIVEIDPARPISAPIMTSVG